MSMSPNALLLLTSFVWALWIVHSAFGAPSAIQRQKRQTFDFSSNTGDADTNVDGGSTTTGSADSGIGGNEGQSFNFENASTGWDPADRAPVAEADDVDPGNYVDYGFINENDTNSSYPDYYDHDYPNYYGGDYPNYYDYPDYSDESTDTSLRPLDERWCKDNRALRCFHGTCPDGLNCQCDEGWTEAACNFPCTKKCVHGNCMINRTVLLSGKQPDKIIEADTFCNCIFGYHKERCHELIPDDVALAEAKGRRLAIILGSCLTLAIILSIILPIVLWRKRVIFVMKVVYFFKMWEDNDGKTHDAYISAGTTGRSLKFVKNVLAPKLEQQGFKLFIPSRDQLCGAVISEDIITAIKQSRRTIMVVTPEYLRNDWSGFEVLNAQVEMIKLQQRIIPVILEDVSKETPRMRKSLKHIMESVKCLKVPGYKSTFTDFQQDSHCKKKIDNFWRRLELTMPKKKLRISSDESDCCYTQKELSVQQNKHEKKYSQSVQVPDSKMGTSRYKAYGCIEKFHTKGCETVADSRINPFSVDQLNSSNQDIDFSKFEKCFTFKTPL